MSGRLQSFYDLVILGAGCAGTSVTRELIERDYPGRILLLDERTRFNTPQRWCYWSDNTQPERSEWSSKPQIVTGEWSSYHYRTDNNFVQKNLQNWTYRHVWAPEYFHYHHSLFDKSTQITFAPGVAVASVSNRMQGQFQVVTEHGIVQTGQIIDCRALTFRKPSQNYSQGTGWWQSFLGWEVEGTPGFIGNNSFCLMDFQTGSDHPLAFGYILPLNNNRSLVEFTIFDAVAKTLPELRDGLNRYLEVLNWQRRSPLLQEQGWLPMSTQESFDLRSNNGIWKSGIAGNCARPSSGYAFARIQRQAQSYAQAIVEGSDKPPKTISLSSNMLDSVFLKATLPDNQFARRSFKQLLEKTSGDSLAGFMGEKYRLTNFAGIVRSLPKWPFMVAFARVFLGRGLPTDSVKEIRQDHALPKATRPALWHLPPLLGALALVFLWFTIAPELRPTVGAGVFLGSILLLGMPHGAADISLAPLLKGRSFQYGMFLLYYGGLMALALSLWVLSPLIAIVGFFLMTTWHWGTADVVPVFQRGHQIVRLSSAGLHGLIRGAWILLGPLAFHPLAVDNLLFAWGGAISVSPYAGIIVTVWIVCVVLDFYLSRGLSKAAYLRRWYYLEILFLVTLQMLLDPLWWVAIYFICFHSWRHSLRLCAHLNPAEIQVAKKCWRVIPGSLDALGKACWIIGSLLLLALVYYRHDGIAGLTTVEWVGNYLILISALTLPHAVLIAKLDRCECAVSNRSKRS
jgi:lycopene beta-cyclase